MILGTSKFCFIFIFYFLFRRARIYCEPKESSRAGNTHETLWAKQSAHYAATAAETILKAYTNNQLTYRQILG